MLHKATPLLLRKTSSDRAYPNLLVKYGSSRTDIFEISQLRDSAAKDLSLEQWRRRCPLFFNPCYVRALKFIFASFYV